MSDIASIFENEPGFEESFNNHFRKKEFDHSFPTIMPRWDIMFNTHLYDLNDKFDVAGEELKNLCTNEVKGTVVKVLNSDPNRPVFVVRFAKGDLCVAKYLPQSNDEFNGYCRYRHELKFFKSDYLIETRGYLSNKILTPKEQPQKFIKMDFYDHDLQGLLMNSAVELSFLLQRKIICHVLRALGYLHNNNLIHNNVCPSNILISTDGKVRLTGFSAMCSFANALTKDYNQIPTSTLCRAPEVLMGVEKFTEKVDLWSTAVVFLQMDLGIGIMQGRTREAQLLEIFKYLGTLNENEFPDDNDSPVLNKLPYYSIIKNQENIPRALPDILNCQCLNMIHYLERTLIYNPTYRPATHNALLIIMRNPQKVKELDKLQFPKIKARHHIDLIPPFSKPKEDLDYSQIQSLPNQSENSLVYKWVLHRLDFIRKTVDNFKILSSKMKIQDSYDIRSLKNKINSWGEKVQQKYQFTKQCVAALENRNNWEPTIASMLNDLEVDPPENLVALTLQPFECLLVELKKIYSGTELLLAQSKQFYASINNFINSSVTIKQIWSTEDFVNLQQEINGLNSNFATHFMSLNSYCKLFNGTIDSVLNERKELTNMKGYIAPHTFFINLDPTTAEGGANSTIWINACLSVYKFCMIEFEKAKQIVDILLQTCNPQPEQMIPDKLARKDGLPVKANIVPLNNANNATIPLDTSIANTKSNKSINFSSTQASTASQVFKEELSNFLSNPLQNEALQKNFNQCVKNYEEQYLNGSIKGAFKMPPLRVENLKPNSTFLQPLGKIKLEKGKQQAIQARWESFSKWLAEQAKLNANSPNPKSETQPKSAKNEVTTNIKGQNLIDILQKYPDFGKNHPQVAQFKKIHFSHLSESIFNENDSSQPTVTGETFQPKPIRFTHTYADWRRQNQPYDRPLKNVQVLTNMPVVEFKPLPLDFDGMP